MLGERGDLGTHFLRKVRRPYQGPAVAAKAAGVIKPRTRLDLEIPVHYCVKYGETMRIADNEYSEFQ